MKFHLLISAQCLAHSKCTINTGYHYESPRNPNLLFKWATMLKASNIVPRMYIRHTQTYKSCCYYFFVFAKWCKKICQKLTLGLNSHFRSELKALSYFRIFQGLLLFYKVTSEVKFSHIPIVPCKSSSLTVYEVTYSSPQPSLSFPSSPQETIPWNASWSCALTHPPTPHCRSPCPACHPLRGTHGISSIFTNPRKNRSYPLSPNQNWVGSFN